MRIQVRILSSKMLILNQFEMRKKGNEENSQAIQNCTTMMMLMNDSNVQLYSGRIYFRRNNRVDRFIIASISLLNRLN